MPRATGVRRVSFDFQKMLAAITKTRPEDWQEVWGPDTGCGLDYWFEHRDGRSAYLNVDQTWLSISIDGEQILSGPWDKMGLLSEFVTAEDVP